MGMDQYRDSNRVVWTIAPPDGSSWTVIAYVKDEEELAYDPPPSDIMAATPPLAEYQASPRPPTTEQARVLYIELTNKIEEYARQHRDRVTLRVTAHRDNGWIVVLLIIAAAVLSDPKGRHIDDID